MEDHGVRLGLSRFQGWIKRIGRLHEMVGVHVSESELAEVAIGIETDRGLWVSSLAPAGYQVYAINPKAVSLLAGALSSGRSEI